MIKLSKDKAKENDPSAPTGIIGGRDKRIPWSLQSL